jgi:hypothetical protein
MTTGTDRVVECLRRARAVGLRAPGARSRTPASRPYSRVREVGRAACSALSGDERTAVLAGNTRAIYLDGRMTGQHSSLLSGAKRI